MIKDDSTYKNAVAPLRTIRIIMAVFLGIVVVVGICLLKFIIIHSIKKRTREVGILMSVGLPGKQIKKQLILEHIIIGVAAYACALVIGIVAAPVFGNQLLGVVNRGTEEKFYTKEEIEAAGARGEVSRISEMAKNQRVGISAPESINAEVDLPVAVIVLLSEMVIIYLCVNTAIKKTLKLEPIRVLSMIE